MDVLVVERDPVVRLGLSVVIARQSRVVAGVADPSAALSHMELGVDVVVAGVAPDDHRAFSLATRDEGAPALLLVTPRLSDALVTAVFRTGARGLMLRDSVIEQITDGIRRVARGEMWMDPHVSRVLDELRLKGRLNGRDRRGLSVQQRRVLRLLPQRLTNDEIAEELGVSTNTVKTHLRVAMAKLGVKDRVEAARIAEQEGIR